MTCPTCDALRRDWYARATPVPIVSLEQLPLLMKVVKKDRQRKDYQAALAAYQQHRKECITSTRVLFTE